MTAPIPAAPVTEPPAEPIVPVTPEAPAQEPAGTDWKAEARKWEGLAKASKPAVDELAALKAAQMTDAEKSAARMAELEAKLGDYAAREQAAAWKAEVAQATGVPVAALAGSSLEEIQAHADVLKSLITSQPQPRGPLVPSEGTGGQQGVTQLTDSDLSSMTPAQINEARRSGRLNRLLGVS